MKRNIEDIKKRIELNTVRFKKSIDAIVGQKKIASILGNSNRNYLKIYRDFPMYNWDKICYVTPGEFLKWIIYHIEELGFTKEERKIRSKRIKPGPGRSWWWDGVCKKCGSLVKETASKEKDYKNRCSNKDCVENKLHHCFDTEFLDYYEHKHKNTLGKKSNEER
jgi:hypothetical protein